MIPDVLPEANAAFSEIPVIVILTVGAGISNAFRLPVLMEPILISESAPIEPIVS